MRFFFKLSEVYFTQTKNKWSKITGKLFIFSLQVTLTFFLKSRRANHAYTEAYCDPGKPLFTCMHPDSAQK